MAYRTPIIFFILFCFSSCTGRSKNNKQLSEFIRQFHKNGYSFDIFFDASSAKDSLKIYKEYGLYQVPATMYWTLSRKKAAKMRISNNYSFNLEFPLNRFEENERNLLKLIKPVDTISKEEFVPRDNDEYFMGDLAIVHINPKAVSLVSINRFTGSHTTAYLDDAAMNKALLVKYKSNLAYEMTKYMIAHKGVQDERLFYYPQTNKDTVIALANFTTIDYDGKDTNIKRTLHLQKYLNGVLVGTYPFYSNPDGYFFKNYYVEPCQFIYKGDKVIMMVSQYPRTDTSLRVLAEFEQDKENTYRFVQFYPVKYPDEYIKRKLLYLVTDMNMQYPYYILPASNEVTNITTGACFKIEGLFKDSLAPAKKGIDVYMDRYLVDFRIDKEKKCHFILFENRNCYAVVYDFTRKLIESRTLLWPIKNGRSIPKFDNWDCNYIFYFESNYLIRRRINLAA